MKIEDVKVGDRIYYIVYSTIERIHVVERLTKTQIVCYGGCRLCIKGGAIRGRSETGVAIGSYKLETDALKEKLVIQNITQKTYHLMRTVNLSKLSLSDLEQISKILSKYKDK